MAIVITIVIIAVAVLFAVYVYRESTGFTVVNYEFYSDKIKKDIKIAYLSDLHNNEYGECNADLINSIDEIKPDIVIFGGDIITCSTDRYYDFTHTLKFIRALSEKYVIYYGTGNHEAKLKCEAKASKGKYEELISFLNEINVPFLADSKVSLSEYGIDLYCLDIGLEYYKRVVTRRFPDSYIKNKLGTPDKNMYSILIAHNPDYFERCAEWGAELVLSGHTHGGVVGVPHLGGLVSPTLKLFPKYDSGIFEEGGSTMILSRGIGTHTLPIRINNKAEIVTIEIKREGKGV